MSGPFANLDTGKLDLGSIDPRTEKSAWGSLGIELTWSQRLYGFGGCFVLAAGLSVLGAIMFVVGQTALFALFYTLGVCVSLAGTGFLLTFSKQFKLMFKPVRLVASALMLGCIAMVFVGAFVIGADSIVLVFAILTYFAYAWYTLSYIPFARKLVKNTLGGMF